MTGEKGKSIALDVQALLSQDEDYLPRMVQTIVEATLEAEMTAVRRSMVRHLTGMLGREGIPATLKALREQMQSVSGKQGNPS